MFFITSDKVYIINLTRFNKKCVEQVFLLALPLISNLVEFSETPTDDATTDAAMAKQLIKGSSFGAAVFFNVSVV